MTLKLSKQEIIKEILKCGKDPLYFINNYCRISHPLKGLIPFNTYPYQDDLVKDFNDYRFTVILKARQLGISTISAAYAVWFMLFHKEKNILVMATKFGTAANLVKKVKMVMKNLPKWMQVASITVDNRTSFELSNGSTIKAVGTSADAGRSEALSLLIIDEAAHVDGLDDLWAGLYPTLSTGGRCIALSTPMGVGNWFHRTYIDAENGDNEFHPVSLPWDVHPERDQDWFVKETKNMSRRQIAQELECNFNTSGETVIHPDDIHWLFENQQEPEYKTGWDRNMWIWEKHQEGVPYLMVADVARGDGADSSVFHILRTDSMEVVAEYQGKPTMDHFAKILFDAGKEYGNCLMVIENVGIGIAACEKVRDLGYPNLYYSIKSTHEYVDSLEGEYNDRAVIGFTTSVKTRPLIVAKLEEYVRNKLVKPRSSRLFHEVKTFIWNNGKPQAMRSYHDDLIMALAIACWVRDTALEVSEKDKLYQQAMITSIKSSQTTMNTSIKGMRGYTGTKTQESLEEFEKTYKDFAWIFKG